MSSIEDYKTYAFITVVPPVLGTGIGLALRKIWTYRDYKKLFYLQFPGRLVLNVLKMIIAPHIMSCMITMLTSKETTQSGLMTAVAFTYYVLTTLLGQSVGIMFTYFMFGQVKDKAFETSASYVKTDHIESILGLVTQLFPENLVTAAYEKKSFVYKPTFCRKHHVLNTTCLEESITDVKIYEGTNVLGLVVFSIFVSIIINNSGREGHALKECIRCVNSVVVVAIKAVIWYIPIGSTFLIAHNIVICFDLTLYFDNLAMYFGIVMATLAIYSMFILPLTYIVCTRRNPFKLAYKVRSPLLTAWWTSSSSAAIKLNSDYLINIDGMSNAVLKFATPLGDTINKDGTAIFAVISCVFISDTLKYRLSSSGIIVLRDHFRTAANLWGNYFSAGMLCYFFPGPESEVANTRNESISVKVSGSDGASIISETTPDDD